MSVWFQTTVFCHFRFGYATRECFGFHELWTKVGTEFKKRTRCRDLNSDSNGKKISKMVRLELKIGRLEVLNLGALWCSSGACGSVVNSSLVYISGRKNRLCNQNRSKVSCWKSSTSEKEGMFWPKLPGTPLIIFWLACDGALEQRKI